MLKTKTQVEKNLETAVFGDEDFFENFKSESDDAQDEGDVYGGLDDTQLFVIDDQGDQDLDQDDDEDEI